jgi:peptidyl-prolyl cis-trans isomerase C
MSQRCNALRIAAYNTVKMVGKMKRVRIISTRCFAIFVFSSCLFGTAGAVAETAFAADSRSAPSSSRVVATVNNGFITEADVEVAIAASGERDTIVLRRAITYQLIALELLRQAAAQTHYTSVKMAARRKKQVGRSIVSIQLYLREAVRPAPVTDADVKARYGEIVSSLCTLPERPENGARDVDPIETRMQLNQCRLSSVAARNIAWENKTWRSDALRVKRGLLISGEYKRNGEFPTKVEFRNCFVSGLFAVRTLWCSDHGFPESDAVRLAENPRSEALLDYIREQLETERLDEAIRVVVENLMARANISE